ncbi:di-trans,poly-cis-decaprenylcistransferase [Acidobacteria bacterium AB60]|nr:di-trans,poly-cis-decaprenylcistransferase [Acidobacteria bacterium AB60]
MTRSVPAGLHVAIIMDGNGRWATRRGLPRVAGHRAGLATAKRIVEHAPDIGVSCLTLYAFSADNWRRPEAEVHAIFWLLRAFLRLQTDRLRERGARLQVIGRRDRLPEKVLRVIETSEAATAAGTRIHLRVAIDYSSRDSIVRAACAGALNHPIEPDRLRPYLTQALTAESGEVDLLIRTGGEKRLSDFLLWESAYAELLFTDRMWPDFNEADLDAAVDDFRHRERRFGGVPTSSSARQATVSSY